MPEFRPIETPPLAVSICPYCGASKPYASRLDQLIQCGRQSCRRTFQVIPEKKKNWQYFSEYEEEQQEVMKKERGRREELEKFYDDICMKVNLGELTQREAAKKALCSLGKFNRIYQEWRAKKLVQSR